MQSTLPLEPFLKDYALQSEKIIGSIISKMGIKISDTSKKNIVVNVVKSSVGFDVEFLYRNALRFRDMGAGRGWQKGQKITAESYTEALKKHKPRKQIRITNRPTFARIHRLEEALAVKIEDMAIDTIIEGFKKMNLDNRLQNALMIKAFQRSSEDRNSKSDRDLFKKKYGN